MSTVLPLDQQIANTASLLRCEMTDCVERARYELLNGNIDGAIHSLMCLACDATDAVRALTESRDLHARKLAEANQVCKAMLEQLHKRDQAALTQLVACLEAIRLCLAQVQCQFVLSADARCLFCQRPLICRSEWMA